MPKYMITPFAENGVKTTVPEISQANGSVSYPQGYPANYERNLETDPLALPIERAKFKQLLYDITANQQDQQIYGLPPFIAKDMNNGAAFAYPLLGMCRYDDGSGLKGYLSVAANNINLPSINGATQAGWAKILDPKNGLVFKNDLATNAIYGLMRFASDAEAAQGILNNVAVTPAQLLKASSLTGEEKPWRGPLAPSGWLMMHGQVLSRSTFRDLFNFAVANQMITDEGDWHNNQRWGLYSHGDGHSTFRLPNMQGMYLCGYEAGYHSTLGRYHQDQIVNITGTFDGNMNDGDHGKSGAFYYTGQAFSGSDGSKGGGLIGFDASRMVRTGARVQPRTLPVNWIVKY